MTQLMKSKMSFIKNKDKNFIEFGAWKRVDKNVRQPIKTNNETKIGSNRMIKTVHNIA